MNTSAIVLRDAAKTDARAIVPHEMLHYEGDAPLMVKELEKTP